MSPELEKTVQKELNTISHFSNPYISSADLKIACGQNETLMELYTNMVSNCVRYLISVCEFMLTNIDRDKQFQEIDMKRKVVHNSTIDSINILARNLKNAGKDNSWISKMLGNRSAYAKFAQLIAFETIKEKEIGNEE